MSTENPVEDIIEVTCCGCDGTFKITGRLVRKGTCTCPDCNLLLKITSTHDPEWGALYFTSEADGSSEEEDDSSVPILSEYVRELIRRGACSLEDSVDEIVKFLSDQHRRSSIGTPLCCDLIGSLVTAAELSPTDLSSVTGIPRSTVYNLLRIHKKLSPTVLTFFRDQRVSYKFALTVSFHAHKTQIQVAMAVLTGEIEPAEVARRCKLLEGAHGSSTLNAAEKLSELAQEHTGYDLSIDPKSDNSGLVTMRYFSLEMLEDFLIKLGLPREALDDL